VPLLASTKKKEVRNFEDLLETTETVAFLIIKKDTIIYENYFEGYTKVSVVPSFSMAKSIISILTGCAIDDGLIRSVKEPVTNYIPELKKNGFDKVTIENLLQMTSGIDYNEGNLYTVGNLYYSNNLKKIISKLKSGTEPGTNFRYLNVNAQLMGFVLEKALNGRSITQYFQEKIWKPIGMEYDASWSIDSKKNGMEKAFCCINICARDYAKIGRLYLNKGNWNGKQIVSETWVANSTRSDTTNGGLPNYKYFWWLPTNTGDFMAVGKEGQFIYVNPSKDLIIVRLGRKNGGVDWGKLFVKLAHETF
jgi:CubicO group peptidase (beta-lactamase class C family)